MAVYPGGIYSPREKENKPGIEYDADKKHVIFIEDINNSDAEIIAIETELGLNPKGEYDNVAARLDALALKSYLAIGEANKRWIPLILEGYRHERSGKTEHSYRNIDGQDNRIVFGMPLPLIINGKNLVITRTKIGIDGADDTSFITFFTIIGWTDHEHNTSIFADTTDIKTVREYTYNHADFTIGGNYERIIFLFDTIVPAVPNLKISYVQVEYYYV